MITPTDEQNKAIKAIIHWYENEPRQQEFLLDGEAGTGKSSTVQVALAELRNRHPALRMAQAAYTAKAALVMKQKGAPNASTIHRLIYRARHDDQGRLSWELWRNGPANDAGLIVLDECFVPQTIIDTPFGGRCIADLRPGDLIYSGAGVDMVMAVSRKEAKRVIQVNFEGITQTCSEDHPFFTERGLVRACKLRLGERLAPTAEAMRFLRQYYSTENELEPTFLQQSLWYELAASIPRISSTDIYGEPRAEVRTWAEEISSKWISGGISADRPCRQVKPFSTSRSAGEDKCNTQTNWSQTSDPRGKWSWFNNTTGEVTRDPWEWVGSRIHCCDGKTKGTTASLQTRLSFSVEEIFDRDRRSKSHGEESTRSGSEERDVFNWPRVDSVTFLECGDSRLDQFRNANGKLYLYDIQATRHSSFSVNGVLVHNCSMISNRVADDLRSFSKKILILGDVEGQLPPIHGEGAFTNREPDFRLRELNRFAMEDPINSLAQRARRGVGKLYPAFSEGNVVLKYFTTENYLDAILNPDTQIICGRHKVRWAITRSIRSRMGYDTPMPQMDEPIICCQNNYKMGILNGEFFRATSIEEDAGLLQMTWDDEEGSPQPEADVSRHLFDAHYTERKPVDPEYDPNVAWMDFAYAITCHKAQGSEWPHVTIIDDSASFGWSGQELKRRWLYTAITRASGGLTLLLRK